MAMISASTYLERGKGKLRRWALNPGVYRGIGCAARALAGFCLSAAAVGGYPLPLAVSLCFCLSGISALAVAAGGVLGYLVFWGSAGYQGMALMGVAALFGLIPAVKRGFRAHPLLLPATVTLILASSGVLFQTLGLDAAPVGIFLLRLVSGAGSAVLFSLALSRRDPLIRWSVTGLTVLALAQIVPVPYLGLGYIAVGALSAGGSFPEAALAGLALDLAQITPVPMTAVPVLVYLVRVLPKSPRWAVRIAPVCAGALVMGLCGKWDLYPLPGLLLGGLISFLLPAAAGLPRRRGEVGAVQVRLELASNVMAQTQQLLMEIPEIPVDEDGLVTRAAERACRGCAFRSSCKDERRIAQLPGLLLRKSLLTSEELPIVCRKSGRFLAELHRGQEQLRSIYADRQRQQEYREAVIQQYRFLSEFLRDLADGLPGRGGREKPFFRAEVAVYANRPREENGDRCLHFAGVGCLYYVLLCDGMGTGMGALREGETAGTLLRKLLAAGYPAEHALKSLNSLCALRERAGAVTVDLAELALDTGKAVLYKWGAAPSYFVTEVGAEKVGAVTPPPGISVTGERESSCRLSMRRGELLLLASDGVDEQEALRCSREGGSQSPGSLAARILTASRIRGNDDATVVTVRLKVR